MSEQPQPAVVALDQALAMYRTMVTIRAFEMKAGSLFAAGQLPGFIHLSIGQEAVAAGVCAALERTDEITTTHRGHGHCIAKGGQLTGMMAELYGRRGGYAKGRSGSMHIADNSVGILGANAIVGGGLPMAVGAAYSSQVLGDGRVAVAFFGEGAVAEGVFHEAMNLAALWRLPMIFVCENNGYAEMTPISVHLANPRVAAFAEPYGIPGSTIDGNDVLAVRAAAVSAVERARSGLGPSLIECTTYRWRGHFEGDPQRYRTKQESREWELRDPLLSFRDVLIRDFSVPDEQLASIQDEADHAVEAAVQEAEGMDPTPVAWLLDDVYHGSAPGMEA
jgi:acetoin:2,6-dichlorophenolindophenol oxidoreductase subunit alpha